MEAWQTQGKIVHHRCGYRLWARAAHQFEEVGDGSVVAPVGAGGDVVVEYRDLSRGDGPIVYLCPGCGRPLQLWWTSGGRQVGPRLNGGAL